MAFKTVEEFNNDRHLNKFVIQNDKESADVVFLYQSYSDMLVADAHYLKSASYSGYVHCCGNGCPICAIKKADGTQAIRTQSKIFIPVYNINKKNPDNPDETGVIEFWDRTPKFEQQFKQDVFDLYPNPSEYVFKVIRHGVANDINTRYEIRAIGRNTVAGMSYQEILDRFHAKMPDYYENIIKAFSIAELTDMLQATHSDASTVTQDYVPIPRAGYQSSLPNTYVNAADAIGEYTEAPTVDASDLIDEDPENIDPTF